MPPVVAMPPKKQRAIEQKICMLFVFFFFFFCLSQLAFAVELKKQHALAEANFAARRLDPAKA
jgi:hypothetical protein